MIQMNGIRTGIQYIKCSETMRMLMSANQSNNNRKLKRKSTKGTNVFKWSPFKPNELMCRYHLKIENFWMDIFINNSPLLMVKSLIHSSRKLLKCRFSWIFNGIERRSKKKPKLKLKRKRCTWFELFYLFICFLTIKCSTTWNNNGKTHPMWTCCFFFFLRSVVTRIMNK